VEVGISAAPSIAHELYERYSGQIFGFCVNQLGSREEAEDALQSTFLNAHRALQRGVTPDAELPWLFKIAHNVCLTRRRSTRRRGRVESPSDFEAVQDVVPAPPREARDELIQLSDALADMPDNQRRAILLREWKGLSYHEIAAELELSQSAVETLIFRARRTLAANLEAKPGLLARARQALDLGSLVAAVKTLFEGAVAVKATAAAVAVSSAVVVATAPSEDPRPTAVEKPGAQVAKAPARRDVTEAFVSAPVETQVRGLAASADPRRVAPARADVQALVEQALVAPPPRFESVQPAPAPEAPATAAVPAVGVEPPSQTAVAPEKKTRHRPHERARQDARQERGPAAGVRPPTVKPDDTQPAAQPEQPRSEVEQSGEKHIGGAEEQQVEEPQSGASIGMGG